MAKSYNGLDRTEAFFAHYGRKGMKRGMNIYNPDYKPIGEKAQLTNKAVKAKKASGVKLPKAPGATFTENVITENTITENTITEKANRKPPSKKTSNVGSLSSTDPRYAAPSAKDRERAAMEAASKAGSAQGAKARRDRLLAAERQRQATSGTAATEAAKYKKSADKNNAKDSEYINAVESLYLKDVEGLDAISKQIGNSNPDAAHTNQYLNELLSEAKKALDKVKAAKLSGDKGELSMANHNYDMALAAFMKQYITAMYDRYVQKL